MKLLSNDYIAKETKLLATSTPALPSYYAETYSQRGEDIVIAGYVEKLIHYKPYANNDIFYLDIGANHPIATSNTYLLYKTTELGVYSSMPTKNY